MPAGPSSPGVCADLAAHIRCLLHRAHRSENMKASANMRAATAARRQISVTAESAAASIIACRSHFDPTENDMRYSEDDIHRDFGREGPRTDNHNRNSYGGLSTRIENFRPSATCHADFRSVRGHWYKASAQQSRSHQMRTIRGISNYRRRSGNDVQVNRNRTSDVVNKATIERLDERRCRAKKCRLHRIHDFQGIPK